MVHSVQFLAFQHSWYQRHREGCGQAGLPPKVTAAVFSPAFSGELAGDCLASAGLQGDFFNGCVKSVTLAARRSNF